jgi:hypothetical protein
MTDKLRFKYLSIIYDTIYELHIQNYPQHSPEDVDYVVFHQSVAFLKLYFPKLIYHK